MRVRLRNKPKPDNYTESCRIDATDGWRERNVWYPGRPVQDTLKEVSIVQGNKAVLSVQESAEVIVVKKKGEGPNQ